MGYTIQQFVFDCCMRFFIFQVNRSRTSITIYISTTMKKKLAGNFIATATTLEIKFSSLCCQATAADCTKSSNFFIFLNECSSFKGSLKATDSAICGFTETSVLYNDNHSLHTTP